MNCKKHGEIIGIPVNVHVQGDPRPPLLQFFCSKCMFEDRAEEFSRSEKKKQFDELAKEAEAQESLEMDAKIENLKRAFFWPEKMARARGLIQDCLHIKEMEEFDKAGLVKALEKVEKILTELTKENDKQ